MGVVLYFGDRGVLVGAESMSIFHNVPDDLGAMSVHEPHSLNIGDIFQIPRYFDGTPYFGKVVEKPSATTLFYRDLKWHETAWECLRLRLYRWAAITVYEHFARKAERQFPEWVSVW